MTSAILMLLFIGVLVVFFWLPGTLKKIDRQRAEELAYLEGEINPELLETVEFDFDDTTDRLISEDLKSLNDRP